MHLFIQHIDVKFITQNFFATYKLKFDTKKKQVIAM
jgi:hypothetical protein